MLKDKGIEFNYREYTETPLSESELRQVLKILNLPAQKLLRKNDKAYKELGLTGREPEEELIRYMAAHPTLLQRPIGIKGARAVLGRPIENLLTL